MYHLHVGYISQATPRKVASVVDYIARQGRYGKRGDSVRQVFVLGMPAWVSPPSCRAYWEEADSPASRVNGRKAFTVEWSLPKILSPEKQRELALLMALKVSELSRDDGAKFPLLPMFMGIHEGGGKNPHVHLLVSTSMPDGIPRSKATWFKRHNRKQPESGGAKRSRTMGTKSWLRQLRKAWADLANAYLAEHGYSLRIDHRSHKDRGIQEKPAIHLGPSANYLMNQKRPSPRVDRYLALVAEREAARQLELDMAASARLERELLAQAQSLEQSRLITERQMLAEIDQALDDHPFGGPPQSTSASMKWMLYEEGLKLSEQWTGLMNQASEIERLGKLAGPDWFMREHRHGIFFIRPEREGLILVRTGLVISDCETEEALDLGARLAMALPFVKPVLKAKEKIFDMAQSVLDRLGLNWLIQQSTSPGSGPSASSKGKKPRT